MEYVESREFSSLAELAQPWHLTCPTINHQSKCGVLPFLEANQPQWKDREARTVI
jgi:hypothetical protein